MKHLKQFDELNELSRELIYRASDAMIDKGQHKRAARLFNTYNKKNYKFDQFIDKPLFDGEFIINIEIKKEPFRNTEVDVINVRLSNKQEFNTTHGSIYYYIDEDKWIGLPHKNNVSRQDARLLAKIAAVVNPETKYLKGTGDIEIGMY
jgi:hypothetical protein